MQAFLNLKLLISAVKTIRGSEEVGIDGDAQLILSYVHESFGGLQILDMK